MSFVDTFKSPEDVEAGIVRLAELHAEAEAERARLREIVDAPKYLGQLRSRQAALEMSARRARLLQQAAAHDPRYFLKVEQATAELAGAEADLARARNAADAYVTVDDGLVIDSAGEPFHHVDKISKRVISAGRPSLKVQLASMQRGVAKGRLSRLRSWPQRLEQQLVAERVAARHAPAAEVQPQGARRRLGLRRRQQEGEAAS